MGNSSKVYWAYFLSYSAAMEKLIDIAKGNDIISHDLLVSEGAIYLSVVYRESKSEARPLTQRAQKIVKILNQVREDTKV